MTDAIKDVIGIGFGPSNLALAVAIHEHNATRLSAEQLSHSYFERQPAFGWHRGMLIDGATLQVSFIKDLATMRNPASEYGFLSYLHSNGRLADFANQKSMFPSRIEFHDYLEWVAGKFEHLVEYDAEVISLWPSPGGDHLEVIVNRVDQIVTRRAKNVVIAMGQEPALPEGAELGERVWHCAELMDRLRQVPEEPHRAVVIGAGQSAAEVTEYLHRRFERIQIFSILHRYGYSVADNTPFVNQIFGPEAVDFFYDAPEHIKQMLLGYHRNTNYSVVDETLTEELYRRVYQERVRGEQRLRVLNATKLRRVRQDGPGPVSVDIENLLTGEVSSFDADLLIYATGYKPIDPCIVLGDTARLCHRDTTDRLKVTRDYSLETGDHLSAGIYLQGGTEYAHGLSSQLLSTTAVRAGEIVQSIVERTEGNE